MIRSAALPFVLTRGSEVFTGEGMTTTRETVHGLLIFEGDTLTMQWRVGTRVDRLGSEMSTESDVGPVREVTVPLEGIASANLRRRWLDRFLGPRIVLTAADLTAFEGLAGPDGLKLDHPAELILPLRRADRLAGEEFCAELELAIAERLLESRPPPEPLPPSAQPAPPLDRRGPTS